jgi:hypothetical protein
MDQARIDRHLTRARDQAQALSNVLDADIVFFNGVISYSSSKYFLNQCRKRKRKKPNVALVIVSAGGDADAAYRIARHLQEKYSDGKIYAVVPGQCKSAATLLIIGAHQIYMGDFGELGPLDVQISKKDELWEETSGLNVEEALKVLENKGQTIFLDYVHMIKNSFRTVTFKTAAEVSISLTEKLLAPIAARINPLQIGENSRAMDIAKNYAMRLDKVPDNLKSVEALDFLLSSYPNHGFVIDLREANLIFRNVLPFTDEMNALDLGLGKLAREPLSWDGDGVSDEPFDVQFLSEEPPMPPAPEQQTEEQQPSLTVVNNPSSDVSAAE